MLILYQVFYKKVMNRYNSRETIEEYDKRIKGNILYILGLILFVAFQFWICDLLNIVV